MMASAALYTPEVLQLATGLAAYGWDEGLPLKGSARSRSCGSTLELGLSLDDSGRIDRLGMRAQACAIGQAAAAIFAGSAAGMDAGQIERAHEDMRNWLAGTGPLPDWRDLDIIAPAQAYPGRHGAILLAWQAASEVLSTR
jgi:NifU-like protein involved in Fe-S cluster formation